MPCLIKGRFSDFLSQWETCVQLANMNPDRIINTHMEFVAPAIQRMTHVNLLDDGRNRTTGN